MKKLKLIPTICAIAVLFASCKKEDTCTGFGTLKLTNTSASHYHKIVIDSIDYGTLDPGKNKEVRLAAGSHILRFAPFGGSGNGCSSATVIVVECQTQSFTCGG